MREGKRVCLRPLRDDDVMIMLQWINDPEVIQYTNAFRPISESEQRAWFESLLRLKDQLIMGIELKRVKKLIGSCGLYNIEWQHRKAELRIKIGEKKRWGKGYGREAIELLLDVAFLDYNLNRVWLKVLANNERAVSVYRQVGFEEEGILRGDMFIRGSYCDVILMALHKKEAGAISK